MYCFKSKQNSLYLSSESVFISLSSFTFQPVIGKSAQLFMAYLRIAFITGEFEFRFLRVTSASLLTPIMKAQTWLSVDSRNFKDSDFKYPY